MAKSFSVSEIVELGIQIEKNGKDFYSILADKTESAQAKAILGFLADSERQHILSFREIFSNSCQYSPEGEYPDDYFAYMNYMASQFVFTREGKGKEIAENIKSYEEGLDMAIKFEKESILFYEGMKNGINEKDGQIVDSLINEEESHLKQLCSLKGVDYEKERDSI